MIYTIEELRTVNPKMKDIHTFTMIEGDAPPVKPLARIKLAKTADDVGVAGTRLSVENVWNYATNTLLGSNKDSEVDVVLRDTSTPLPAYTSAINTLSLALESSVQSVTTAVNSIQIDITEVLDFGSGGIGRLRELR